MNNKKGYTIVEALIAMLLVAIVVGGIFSALMAARRAISEPSSREDTYFTAEDILNTMRACTSAKSMDENPMNSDYLEKCGQMLSSGAQVREMFEVGEHANIADDKLPESCTGNSSITYTVTSLPVADPDSNEQLAPLSQIDLHIVCNKGTKL